MRAIIIIDIVIHKIPAKIYVMSFSTEEYQLVIHVTFKERYIWFNLLLSKCHISFFQANLEDVRADAYVVVFSIAHRDTFDVASDLLSNLRMDLGTDRSIILVGNKLDLVRKRKVKTEGSYDKMKNKKYYNVGTLSKSNIKMVERDQIGTPYIQLHDRSFKFYLGLWIFN